MAFKLTMRPDLPDYEMDLPLDGETFTLRFRWSAREAAHYMDVYDQDGERVAAGLKVVLGRKLGLRRIGRGMPAGALIAVDTARRGQAPGETDLGDRVQVYYLEADELG